MGGPNKVNEGGGVQAGADFEDGGAPPLKKRLTARQKGGGVSTLGARQAYLDGELCGVGPNGITSFSMIQLASDAGNATGLVFFPFDLLHLEPR